jgi:hypothetical protein
MALPTRSRPCADCESDRRTPAAISERDGPPDAGVPDHDARQLRAVQSRAFVTVPYSGSTLGVKNGAGAYNLAEAVPGRGRTMISPC